MDHALHLFFSGASPTCDSFFDLVRGVFDNLGAGGRSGRHSETAHLGHSHCGARVDLKKYSLYRHHIWAVFVDESLKLFMNSS